MRNDISDPRAVKIAAKLFAKAQDKYGIGTGDMVRGIAFYFTGLTVSPETKRVHDALITVAELIERGGV